MSEDNHTPRLSVPSGCSVEDRVGQARLRFLAVADFAPGSTGSPRVVTRTDLDALVAELAPRVELRVPNRLGTNGPELSCTLHFTRMRDFHPDAVVEQVQVLSDLARARAQLDGYARGETEAGSLQEALRSSVHDPELVACLEQPPPAVGAGVRGDFSTPGQGSLVDSLLDQVEVPAAMTQSLPASLGDLLAAAVSPTRGATVVEREAVARLVAEIDLRLTRQVAAIMDSKPWREVEAAWRGLRFLLERADTRRGVEVEVLSTSREGFLDEFYQSVFTREYEGSPESPLTCVITDFEIGRGAEDLELLRTLARMGESLQVPFAVAASPQFWGMRQAQLLAALPNLADRCQGPEYAKWNSFRADDASLWVVLSFNRFLARGRVSEGQPVKSFTWQVDGVTEEPLWAQPTWALGAAVAQGFAETGIRFRTTGSQPPTLLEELPVRATTRGKVEQIQLCLEVLLNDKQVRELIDTGFTPLMARANADSAYFPWTTTYHLPKRYNEHEATRASYLASTLSYQLLAGTISHRLQKLAEELAGGRGVEELRDQLQGAFLALLGTAEEAPRAEEAEVEITPIEDAPGQLQVLLRLRPGFMVENGEVDLVVGTTIRA